MFESSEIISHDVVIDAGDKIVKTYKQHKAVLAHRL